MARRKKSEAGEPYTAFLGLQLTPSQRQSIEAEAARAGRSLSDFARLRLLRREGEPPPVSRDTKALRELAAEIGRIGNNLNQLARIANQTGHIRSENAIEAVTGQLSELFEKVISL